MSNQPQINILIPLYNEEDIFNDLYLRLVKLMDNSELSISVIMVDDGSSDKTPKLMEDLSLKDNRFTSIFLSRNFGHQLALTAAFDSVNATEAVLVIDGDLQDPPELLEEFYSYYKQGYDVVYAVRKSRIDSFFKKITANIFYKILKKVSSVKIPLDTGDFSLISRRVIDSLNTMREENRFIRGMRSWVGYNQIGIEYERQGRTAGNTKYTLSKMIKLALNGLFGFSEFPIRFISVLGLITILISLAYFLLALVKMLFLDGVVEGFTGLIFTIILFGGVQLLSIGVLGEYILRIFFQVKERPLFIIKKQIKDGEIL